jgi:hypothetical protein
MASRTKLLTGPAEPGRLILPTEQSTKTPRRAGFLVAGDDRAAGTDRRKAATGSVSAASRPAPIRPPVRGQKLVSTSSGQVRAHPQPKDLSTQAPSGAAGRGFVALTDGLGCGRRRKPPAPRSRRKALLFDLVQRFGGFRYRRPPPHSAAPSGGGVGIERHLGFGQPCRAVGGGNRRHPAALGVSRWRERHPARHPMLDLGAVIAAGQIVANDALDRLALLGGMGLRHGIAADLAQHFGQAPRGRGSGHKRHRPPPNNRPS